MPDTKYYDKYTSDNLLTACDNKECLSHGLSEIMGWYEDRQLEYNAERPWIVRGYGVYPSVSSGLSGIFAINVSVNSGSHDSGAVFRLVATTS